MTTQTCVSVSAFGGPERLELSRGPVPVPKKGEVLIRVQAAGVSFADVTLRRGGFPLPLPKPFVPGYDVAGLVEAAGSETAFQPGQRVAAMTEVGGYAERVIARSDRVVAIPDGISAEVA